MQAPGFKKEFVNTFWGDVHVIFLCITNNKYETNPNPTNKKTPQALHDHISYNTLFCQYEISENKIHFFQKPPHKQNWVLNLCWTFFSNTFITNIIKIIIIQHKNCPCYVQCQMIQKHFSENVIIRDLSRSRGSHSINSSWIKLLMNSKTVSSKFFRLDQHRHKDCSVAGITTIITMWAEKQVLKDNSITVYV